MRAQVVARESGATDRHPSGLVRLTLETNCLTQVTALGAAAGIRHAWEPEWRCLWRKCGWIDSTEMEFRADTGRLNGYKAGQQWQSTAGLGKKCVYSSYTLALLHPNSLTILVGEIAAQYWFKHPKKSLFFIGNNEVHNESMIVIDHQAIGQDINLMLFTIFCNQFKLAKRSPSEMKIFSRRLSR